MNLSEINKEKDLRKMPFADLFYEIFDEQNGYEIAWNVINRLNPEFEDGLKDRCELARKEAVKISAESLNKEFQSSSGRGMDFLVDMIATKLQGRDLVQEKVESAIEDGLGPSSPAIRTALSGNKILDALSILPHMTSDQELIVFFGNNFHATLQSIDAYTGLLYASEFFEYDGTDLRGLVMGTRSRDSETDDNVCDCGALCSGCDESEGRTSEERLGSSKFEEGDLVEHKTFGRGKVVKVKDAELHVKFDATGQTKRLLKGYAPIVKVS